MTGDDDDNGPEDGDDAADGAFELMPGEDAEAVIEGEDRERREKGVLSVIEGGKRSLTDVRPPTGDKRGDGPPGRFIEDFDPETINQYYALVSVGSGAYVLREDHKLDPLPPPGEPIVHDSYALMTVKAFHDWFSDQWYTGENNRRYSAAQLWMLNSKRRKFRGLTFDPCDEAPSDYYNMYQGLPVAPDPEGSCEKFKAHLLDNVCDGNTDYFNRVFGWFADIFQNPKEKRGVALVLIGGKGTGKSIVGDVFSRLLGRHYFLAPSSRYVTGQFNMHLAQTLLLHADEALWAGDKRDGGLLRDLITGPTTNIERKNIDVVRVRSYLRMLITSEERWVVPAGHDERRYFVLEMGEGKKQDKAYFGAMLDELNAGGYARLMHELLNFDLSTAKLGTAPQTRGLVDQKIVSLQPHFRWWYECLYRGFVLGDEWQDVLVKTDVFRGYIGYCEQHKIGHRQDESEIAKRVIRELVPGVGEKRGAVDSGVDAYGDPYPKRPRMWIFPSLEDCRAGFEAWIGAAVDWPDPEPDERGGANGVRTPADDEEIDASWRSDD